MTKYFFKLTTASALILFFNPINLYASKDCSSYLSDSQFKDVSSNQLVVVNSEGNNLVSIQKRALQLQTNKDSLKILLDSQILHSDFFKTIVERAFGSKEFVPGQLQLLEVNEVQALAIKVYQEIKSTLARNDPALQKLKKINKTRAAFEAVSSEYMIDKIGESLIMVGEQKNFLDHSEFRFNTFAISLIGTIFSYIPLSIANEFLLNIPLLVPAGIVATALAVNIKSVNFNLEKKWLDWKLKRALRSKYQGSESQVLFLYTDTVAGTLSENINRIDARIPTQLNKTDRLLTFGSDIMQLHAEFVKVFVNDFMKWMHIYETKSQKTKEKLISLKEQKGSLQSDPNDVTNFLSKVFIEAGEATKQAYDTSGRVIESMNESLAFLNSLDVNSMSPSEKIEWHDKSKLFRDGLVIQSNFRSYLDQVYLLISKILSGVDKIHLAESGFIVGRLGERLSQESDLDASVNMILQSLDELDLELDKLREN